MRSRLAHVAVAERTVALRQWTGDPATSKVLILNIDVAAEPGHLTHSPILSDGVTPAEGVTSDGTATGTCPAVGGTGNPG